MRPALDVPALDVPAPDVLALGFPRPGARCILPPTHRKATLPLSTDVRLPRTIAAIFPDLCCGCLREQPGDSIVVKGRRVGWLEIFLPWLWFFGKRVRVEVPVCAACRPGLLATRRWTLLLIIVGIGVAGYFVFPWAKSLGLSRSMTKLVSLAAVLAVLAPGWLYWALHPPKFDLTVFRDHIDYEFASPEYARRFADCNPDSISQA